MCSQFLKDRFCSQSLGMYDSSSAAQFHRHFFLHFCRTMGLVLKSLNTWIYTWAKSRRLNRNWLDTTPSSHFFQKTSFSFFIIRYQFLGLFWIQCCLFICVYKEIMKHAGVSFTLLWARMRCSSKRNSNLFSRGITKYPKFLKYDKSME